MSKTRDDFIKRLARRSVEHATEHMAWQHFQTILEHYEAEDSPETILDIVTDIVTLEHYSIALEAQEVIKSPKYKAETDPRSSMFNPAKYREAMAEPEPLEIITAGIKTHINERLLEISRAIKAYTQSDSYKQHQKILKEATALFKSHKELLEPLLQPGERKAHLTACTIDVLRDYKGAKASKTPEEALQELKALLEQATQTGDNSKLREILDEARKRSSADKEITDIVTQASEIPRITAIAVERLDFPVDKLNKEIWDMLEGADENGQIGFKINTSTRGKNEDQFIYYGINFSALENDFEIIKHLTAFDKLCYIATAALFAEGNDVVTATQIYKTMGSTSNPKAQDLENVNKSLTKMGGARVYIDSEAEAKETKGGYQKFKYDAALLPFERVSAYINGQLTESAIHLFREPPLITFARQRDQITTIERQLLEAPVNKTEESLRIQDYLIEQISHIKKPGSKLSRKMLYSTICDTCKISDKKQRQRAQKKIQRYLAHYTRCGWIKGFTETEDKSGKPDGVQIDF